MKGSTLFIIFNAFGYNLDIHRSCKRQDHFYDGHIILIFDIVNKGTIYL